MPGRVRDWSRLERERKMRRLDTDLRERRWSKDDILRAQLRARRVTILVAKWPAECSWCGCTVEPGEEFTWSPDRPETHSRCFPDCVDAVDGEAG